MTRARSAYERKLSKVIRQTSEQADGLHVPLQQALADTAAQEASPTLAGPATGSDCC